MRTALLALGLAGCLLDSGSSDGSYGGGGGTWGSGWGGGGGITGYGCQSDSECGGLTCTRTGECLSPSLVRAARTTWTVGGEMASTATCSAAPKLSITFTTDAGEQFGYTPVPCDAGKFTVDKLPTRFTRVHLSRANAYEQTASAMFDEAGNAAIDLPF